MSTEPEHEIEETAPDDFIRVRALRRSSRVTQSAFRRLSTEEPKERRPLISQGPRSERAPRPELSVDDAIRATRRSGGVWRPLV
jgi:hypothetical protein